MHLRSCREAEREIPLSDLRILSGREMDWIRSDVWTVLRMGTNIWWLLAHREARLADAKVGGTTGVAFSQASVIEIGRAHV